MSDFPEVSSNTLVLQARLATNVVAKSNSPYCNETEYWSLDPRSPVHGRASALCSGGKRHLLYIRYDAVRFRVETGPNILEITIAV